MSEALTYDSLFLGARKFAHSAMAANAESDLEIFLLHAGVSIERLAKAALSNQSPFLLMEMKGKEDTLFHLAGVRETQKIRTIGAAHALSRLRAMKILPERDPDLDELIELRNGVAHLNADTDSTVEGIATFARTTNTLLAHLQVEHEDYWATWHGTVDIALSEHLERLEREMAGRIESARYRLSKRLEGLPEAAVDIIYGNAHKDEDGSLYGVRVMCGDFIIRVPYICPACRCDGPIYLSLPQKQNEPQTAPALGFFCPLCDFSANGTEELRAIGVEDEVPIVDADGEPLFSLNTGDYERFINAGYSLSRIERLVLQSLIAEPDPTLELRENL
ncbi:hypothetical protein ACFWU3_15125 [Streptomyces sp. NPDC058685]|uniref:hypothetical protein n=1 Tax=Streptomyces sp. NPDC058685 TaxID=3346598 RepID=UPI003647215D